MRLHMKQDVVGLPIPVERRHLGLKGTRREKRKIGALDFQMQIYSETTLLVKSRML